MTESARRPVIVMQAGPLHLFWATGVFYFWELKSRFDFVLLVSEDYRQSAPFDKLIGLPEILQVDYAPQGNRLSRHRHYSKQYQKILLEHRPSRVLLYNQSYPDNLYLAHFCKKYCANVKRYCFQLGRMPANWEADFSAANAEAIAKVVHRYPILSRIRYLADVLVRIKSWCNSNIDHQLLPSLLLGTRLRPPLNVYSGKVNSAAMEEFTGGRLDCQLVYSEREMVAYGKLGTRNLSLIRHPASRVGQQVFKYLYGSTNLTDSILLLPSYGFTSKLLQSGWTQCKVIKQISDRWSKAIVALLGKYPGYLLKMKLHPASRSDPIWSTILENLLESFSNLLILDAMESAEWHIAQSSVVVGDVTSALWWAAMYEEKVVISLDIFDYPGGDEMKDDSGVAFFASIKDLTLLNHVSKTKYNYPANSLSDVIAREEAAV